MSVPCMQHGCAACAHACMQVQHACSHAHIQRLRQYPAHAMPTLSHGGCVHLPTCRARTGLLRRKNASVAGGLFESTAGSRRSLD
eukprot:365075-Chlamydomonas_euryale.AAC.11